MEILNVLAFANLSMMNWYQKIVLPSANISAKQCQILIQLLLSPVLIADLKDRRRRRWASGFFGLTDEYKVQLHELIFDLANIGNIEYFAVYEMPVQYRSFYVRKLTKMKEKERQDYDKAMGKNEATPTQQIVRGPAITRNG